MTMTAPRAPAKALIGDRTRSALRRRAVELGGLALLALAAVFILVLASYSPADPWRFNSTAEAPHNLMGVPGAYVAGALRFSIGWAGWALPAGFAVWGVRFILHRGEERVLTRLVLLLVGVLALAAFLATHAPGPGWQAQHGLGGVLGDSIVKHLLVLLPLSATEALIPVSIGLAAVTVGLVGLGLGINWGEFRHLLHLGGAGLFALAAALWWLIRQLARQGWRALRWGLRRTGEILAERRARAEQVESPPTTPRREPELRRPVLRSEPEAVTAEAELPTEPLPEPGGERLMARIAAAVQARRGEGGLAERLAASGDDADIPIAIAPDRDVWADGARVPPSGPSARTAPPPDPDAAEPAPRVVVRHPAKRPIRQSRAARAEAQPALPLGDEDDAPYDAPPLGLLTSPAAIERQPVSDDALEHNARLLESVLDDYGIRGEITAIRPGPVVTLYEL
ncbi:MAG: DNA translocase FtsK, partial [Alphaproteobacteria bacterium]